MSGDGSPEKHGKHPPWRPGESGNPLGRPKGARNKLGEAFIADLYEAWQSLGMDAILSVIATKPAEYLRVVASLMPKQVEIKQDDDFDGFSDAELAAFISAARAIIKRPGASGENSGDTSIDEPPQGLPPLH